MFLDILPTDEALSNPPLQRHNAQEKNVRSQVPSWEGSADVNCHTKTLHGAHGACNFLITTIVYCNVFCMTYPPPCISYAKVPN